MSLEKHGSCLCGATKISVTLENASVSACHCSMCRKWAGGPLLVVHSTQQVRYSGREPSIYDSSDWAQRGFCGQCGTHLFYRLKAGGFEAVPVGVLDGDTQWVFDLQVYIDEKPAYYCFANQTREMTGQQVMEQFS
ncbi:GFA family protein [Polyangium sp. 15x6]|uniref:GFA family protein n=1 Tax=Polyangium sp. 15x6 TaxID=3042687 RepID=UPI002499FC7E|nr:GFA family protein [Polyangium sp. 15x6]MDI3284627.1 GFA family protein [Polyangium sp. 15x6]